MTDVLTRPASRPSPPARPGALVVAAPAAAVAAAGAGLLAIAVFVLPAWSADARSGSGTPAALRAAAQVWLAAHGTPVRVPGGVFALLPLGLSALPVVLLAGTGVAPSGPPTGRAGAARQRGRGGRRADRRRCRAALARPVGGPDGATPGLAGTTGRHPRRPRRRQAARRNRQRQAVPAGRPASGWRPPTRPRPPRTEPQPRQPWWPASAPWSVDAPERHRRRRGPAEPRAAR